MSRKARKSVSSLSYYIQKVYWKTVTAKPSTLLLAAIAVSVSVFLLGGGIFDILEKPPIAYTNSEGKIIISDDRGLNMQLLGESAASMVFYSLGIVGLILTYQSTKYVARAREALTTLLIGLALFIIAWMLVEYLLFPSTF